MHGFVVAIATNDQNLDDLIMVGQDNENADENNDNTFIKNVEIYFDTIDDNVQQKSSSMLAKIKIKGQIAQGDIARKMCRKLSDWAHDLKKETQYRNICIGIRNGDDSYQCVYSFKRVFVVNYSEKYHKGDGEDEFELDLTQEQGKMKYIAIDSDWPEEWKWALKG